MYNNMNWSTRHESYQFSSEYNDIATVHSSNIFLFNINNQNPQKRLDCHWAMAHDRAVLNGCMDLQKMDKQKSPNGVFNDVYHDRNTKVTSKQIQGFVPTTRNSQNQRNSTKVEGMRWILMNISQKNIPPKQFQGWNMTMMAYPLRKHLRGVHAKSIPKL